MRSSVRPNSGHPHFGHDLEQTLAQRLDEVAHSLLGRDSRDDLAVDQILHGFHRQVGIDRGRSITDEEGTVVHLTDISRLHDQGNLGACLTPYQMMMNSRAQQQRRDRCKVRGGIAIGQHNKTHPSIQEGIHLREDLLQARLERHRSPIHVVQAHDFGCSKPGEVSIGVDMEDLG